eukprot:Rmarinus@m.19167
MISLLRFLLCLQCQNYFMKKVVFLYAIERIDEHVLGNVVFSHVLQLSQLGAGVSIFSAIVTLILGFILVFGRVGDEIQTEGEVEETNQGDMGRPITNDQQTTGSELVPNHSTSINKVLVSQDRPLERDETNHTDTDAGSKSQCHEE